MNLYSVEDHERRVVAHESIEELYVWLYESTRPPREDLVAGVTIERLPDEDRLTIQGKTRTVVEWAAGLVPGAVLLSEPRSKIAPPFGGPGVRQP